MLQAFGFGSALPPDDRRLFERKVIMLGVPPNRIDLLKEISGVTFEDAWQRRVEGSLDGLPTSYISLVDLIRNKQLAGREKDLADVAALKAINTRS